MNIRFLCVFIFLMCALAAGIADAHTLHVGNKTFALSQTKYTSPSLAFGFGNEVWYAPLAPIFINESLHFRYKNIPFSVDVPDDYPDLLTEYNCPQIFTDTENYTYDNDGRLIGANENLYLKSTGTQYIDTEYVPNSNTGIQTKFKIGDFGYYNNNTYSNSIVLSAATKYNAESFEIYHWQNQIEFNYGRQYQFRNNRQFDTNSIFKVNWNKNIVDYSINDHAQTHIIFAQQNFTAPVTMYLFKMHRPNITDALPTYASIYYLLIHDDNVLLKHMVPVPACMRIGDFIVPENGMWDIVNQQFYGNSGTGSFIYGRDE